MAKVDRKRKRVKKAKGGGERFTYTKKEWLVHRKSVKGLTSYEKTVTEKKAKRQEGDNWEEPAWKKKGLLKKKTPSQKGGGEVAGGGKKTSLNRSKKKDGDMSEEP